jgi:putative intracellular protease/amidase
MRARRRHDRVVGRTVMPFRVEDELKRCGANDVQGGLCTACAVRDGRLITGQQQHSARKVAALLIEAHGI